MYIIIFLLDPNGVRLLFFVSITVRSGRPAWGLRRYSFVLFIAQDVSRLFRVQNIRLRAVENPEPLERYTVFGLFLKISPHTIWIKVKKAIRVQLECTNKTDVVYVKLECSSRLPFLNVFHCVLILPYTFSIGCFYDDPIDRSLFELKNVKIKS